MTRMTKAEAIEREMNRRNIEWNIDIQEAVETEIRTADGKDTARTILNKALARVPEFRALRLRIEA